MFYAYVIKSVHHDFFYKGHCHDLALRLKQHNMGKTRSNKHFAPFHLIYFEPYETLEEAISREKYLKSSAGRRFLKKKLG